jgi:hypothetical protein
VRWLVCLLLGLVAGALMASMATSMLQRRHAWPRALMTVMQHELAAARHAADEGGCGERSAPAAERLRLLAGDLEPALLAPGTHDRILARYAGDLRARLAEWNPQAPCPAQATALVAVSHACDACHRDYR